MADQIFSTSDPNALQIEIEDLSSADPKKIADKIVSILDIKKGDDIKLLQVHSKTIIADYFVICTANSTTHVKSLSDEVEYQMALCGAPVARTDGMGGGEWCVLDFSSVIVHVFIRSAREFYKLDKLWGEAVQIPTDASISEE